MPTAAGRQQAPHSSFFSAPLAESDPELAGMVDRELRRQQDEIELIASENIVSRAVLEAAGSVLTNKYAEGYPGKRYYGGCEYVDEAETLAIERAKKLFECRFANVQPHSGSAGQPGGLHGADEARRHLHGHEPGRRRSPDARLAGQPVRQVVQGRALRGAPAGPAHRHGRGGERSRAQHKPKLIVAGGSAYPRTIDFAAFRAIADEVGAYLMVDMAHFAGLVAGGAHPSPFPHAHVVTTTTHKTLRGPRGGMILTNDEDIGQEDQLGGLPRHAGRTADARHRRQGGGVRRGAAARVQGLRART